MAKEDAEALADRIFSTFLAPLVLGGPLTPGRPIGGARALSMEGRTPPDIDALSRVLLTRVRIARRLAPVDFFPAAPTGVEWALAALLHDLVQVTHPGFDAVLRRSAPMKLLTNIDDTLDLVPPPSSLGDALSRHTWFSRIFEVTRTDVELKWWTGSATFLGTDAPKRLMTWPELRRVREIRSPRPIMELPEHGSAVESAAFASTVETFLKRTPLTDLVTLHRASPPFAWTHENLGIAALPSGRAIVLRALARLPAEAVDRALGRATRPLFVGGAAKALFIAIDLLRDRAIMSAATRLSSSQDAEAPAAIDRDDRGFAVGAGALAASHWIASHGGGFTEAERRALLGALAPAAQSKAAKEVASLLP